MCGFVGILSKDPQRIELNALKKMADTISHRGPDDEGHFLSDHVGFYHKRLSIIDIAGGHQPMSSGDLTIVFNGEIYNYVELREDLVKEGFKFETQSDTEVILKAYQRYGIEAIEKLNGMFAFLIYDQKNNQVIAARDHFGIKPLYYLKKNDCVCFASEIKALLAHPEINANANSLALQEYLTFQFLLDNTTLFEGINKVKPGHFLIIDLDTIKIERHQYWDPDFSVDEEHTEHYFTRKLRELLDNTIDIQLRSDVPLGTYLSGGIDSSIVTLFSAGKLDENIKTFTGYFAEGKEYSETEFSREIAFHAGAEVHEVVPTVEDFINTFPKLIYHMDEPVAGPGLFPQFMVSQLARQHVKVILGGQGGDEIFGGYARYVVAYLEQAIKGSILQSTEEGEHIVSLKSILPNLPYLHSYLPMIKQFWSSETFDSMDRRYFKLIDRLNGSATILSDKYLADVDEKHIFSKFQELFNHPRTLSYFNKMTHFDMFGSLLALLQVEDRVSMAVSIESRVPLLDRRIVDLVASMPPRMKFRGAEMKYLLKRAVSNMLPERILMRKDKMGFPVPLHLWAQNEARDFICDILLSDSCRKRGIYNASELEKLINSESTLDPKLVTSDYAPNIAAEKFRLLSTKLLMEQNSNGNSYIISSLQPNEGKSLIAANLAITFAQQKIPTILLDCDLRRGVLHKTFNCRKKPGLTDLLIRNTPITQNDVMQIIQDTHIPHLHLIPGGIQVPNPTELLGSTRMKQIKNILSDVFSALIVDTPPVEVLTDAVVLNSMVHKIIFVTRYGRTSIKKIHEKFSEYSRIKDDFYGFVINAMPEERKDEYGSYSYYHY